MTPVILPAIWLIVIIGGLPQLSETVYTPSLPDIARALKTSASMVEHTLTIYLFSFAIGTLFWGRLSDKIGRKPCILLGLLIFIIGSFDCYLSESIMVLMLSRFIQAFGGSIGSVMEQAISRDAFHGAALSRVYAATGTSLAIFSAIGPLIGGVIDENFGYANIFLFLIISATFIIIAVILYLPETHDVANRKAISSYNILLSLIKDKKIIGFALIVAGCNGIRFSYFAEGSFYLINLLGLSPSEYGLIFLGISASIMIGGIVSIKLHTHYDSKIVMKQGLIVIMLGSFLFC